LSCLYLRPEGRSFTQVTDKRVDFIYENIIALSQAIKMHHGNLQIFFSTPEEVFEKLLHSFPIQAVYCNEDYEPYAIHRDSNVQKLLLNHHISFQSYKDQVIFSKDEILNSQNQSFHVFTPYKNAWLKKLTPKYYQNFTLKTYSFLENPTPIPLLEDLGFEKTNLFQSQLKPGELGAKNILNYFLKKIDSYHIQRDFPSIPGTSYLSFYNRFGIISIRSLVRKIFENQPLSDGKNTWLSELIWREFYMQLLYHYPRIAKEPFQTQYIHFPWNNNLDWFQKWSIGQTGIPIIDAAMNQLNQTGYMHNRLRMIVASFLTKDLLIDYRLGEQYFAEKLLDFDLSANNGGWQWAASTGCDAAPYFRMFNPIRQSEKFDKDAIFIQKYLPIFQNVPIKMIHQPWIYEKEIQSFGIILGKNYPYPIVDLSQRRKEVLSIFEHYLQSSKN
jgi:deoxyribodipyrimidine photo-lyase